MTRWIAYFTLLLALVLGACDDETRSDPEAQSRDIGSRDIGSRDDAGTPDAGTPDAGTPDLNTPDFSMPDASAPDVSSPDTASTDTSAGACDNPTDRESMTAVEDEIAEAMATCAIECLMGGEDTCQATCAQRELSISVACAACFGDMINCTTSRCALVCMNPDSPDCLPCQEENCIPAFNSCSGIDVPGI